MRACARQLLGCSLLAVTWLQAASRPAYAEPAGYGGTWQAGATSMEVAIQSWGADCGPRPQSTQAQGGGSVQVDQRGQVLTIRGGGSGREVRSDRCWSPNPAMRRAGTSYASGLWTTRCKTPSGDPRQEAGTYTLKALSPDRLLYQDVSHFDWRLKDSTCVATITTTQTLLRNAAGSSTPPGSSATPTGSGAQTKPAAPSAATARCVPGPAARISLRPRDAHLELGQRQCFSARVADAKGCAIDGAPVQFELEHTRAIKAQLHNGCFIAGNSSAEAEGSFTVVASHEKLRAQATVEVAAMTLPALLAKRMEMGAVVGEQAEPEHEEPIATKPASSITRVAAKAVAEATPRDRRPFLVALFALLALSVGGVLLYRARSQPRTRTRKTPVNEPPAQRIRRCPTCGSSYPETSAFCGVDGSALSDPE
jgi:hypothetical protein